MRRAMHGAQAVHKHADAARSQMLILRSNADTYHATTNRGTCKTAPVTRSPRAQRIRARHGGRADSGEGICAT
eukprot:4429401-Lingulodinium_polyedra.AAC.1